MRRSWVQLSQVAASAFCGSTPIQPISSWAIRARLALGMALGCIAIVTKTEVISLIIGGLFVIEALSVMIQVFYFKRTKKRLFLMAPLHHHFEKRGWSEVKVVVRFWIISACFAAVGFCIFFAQTMVA